MAIANQKGGVGKTTTSINLGAYLARLGRQVLVIDSDPQGNATTALGIDIRDIAGRTLYQVFTGELTAAECTVRTSIDGLSILPTTRDLAGIEIELAERGDFETVLRDALRSYTAPWDIVLIDCPPSLGVLTVNALVAADSVVVPVQCEYLALEGVAHLLRTIDLVRQQANPSLSLAGLVLTMFDGRTNLSQQVETEVRTHFPSTFQTAIPRTIRLAEAPSYGQSILEYDPSSRGAEAYNALAEELIARLEAVAA